ncbi:MAG: hypothetical protein RL015_443 [Verrucomicrobiota bacterium]|jgi:hypothetical protein
MLESDLLEKLRKIERLYAGAATPGEKEAAAEAMARIRQRLGEVERVEKPIEYRFTLTDGWSKKLFLALLRRYELRPYRYARQRRNTVMVRVPRSFVNETLWPEFLELSEVLKTYLEEVTNRVIAQAIHEDAGEEEIIAGEYLGQ